MKSMHIIPGFTKRTYKVKDLRQEVLYTRSSNIGKVLIKLPSSSQKLSGILKEDVFKHLQELTRENIEYLYNKYGVTMDFLPNNVAA